MHKPTCKTCGKSEWRHVCAGGVMPPTKAVSDGERVIVAIGPTVTWSAPAKIAKLKNVSPAGEPPIRREGPKFDRVVYQREYMRRRRAKKKSEPASS